MSASQDSKRIEFLDVARGMGIVCVILGHNLWSRSRGSAIIFNFHMPLFYFLSGIFFSPEKAKTRKAIIKKVFSILAPVPFFAAIACLVFLAEPCLLHLVTRRTLYTFLIHGEPWYDKPLWFFVSLAGVVLVFSLVSRLLYGRHQKGRRIVFLAICAVMSFAVAMMPLSFRKLWSPAMVTTLPLGLFYYGLGCFSKTWIERLGFDCKSSSFLLMAIVAIFAVVLLLSVDVATKPDIRTARIGSWLLFPRSLCGIAAVVSLARAIPESLGRPLAYVGRNSVVFFSLEFVTFPYIAKALGGVVPGYNHFKIAELTPYWQSLAAVLSQMIVLAALSPIITRMLSKWKIWLAHYCISGERRVS